MFTLSYFTGVKELVPNGWHTVDEDKTYPALSSRNPQLQQSIDDDSGNDFDMTNGRTASDSSIEDDDLGTEFPNTRMVDESSDDELAPQKVS